MMARAPRRWRRPLSRVVGLTALILLALPAAATVVATLTLEDLSMRSREIVVGRVLSQRAEWVGDRQAIVTRVTVLVGETIKGGRQQGETVEVLREGGEIDGIGMRVHDSAQFTPGEEALLFLESRGNGALWTVGMSRGKWPVIRSGADRFVIDPSRRAVGPQPLAPLLLSLRTLTSEAP